MTNKKIRWDFWTIVTVVIIALFALFLLYPLISLFLSGFKDTETGVWTIDNYARFFSKKYYKSALLNSFKLTFSVTVAAIILGVPLAYFMSFYKIKGKGALEILFIISMMSPNFIGAYSWILLLGRSGTVTQLLKGLGIHMPSIYGFGGMLLVFALKLYPFIYMYVSGALKKIDVALSEAAESLGCGGLKKVLTVIMPLVTPTLIAAALLVFMNCMADFGTPALIGEGYRVMPTLVYSESVSFWKHLSMVFRQLCGMYGDYHGGSHRHRVLASEMVCEYQVLYHELHEADTAQGGLWNQRLFHAPVYLSAGSHLHHTPVHGCVHLLPRCQDAGVCGWIFSGKLPQGVLHSHPVH